MLSARGEFGSEDYRYTGKPEDPSGLYYYGARYYNPVLGRFITRDTVIGDYESPQTLNQYIYCVNNPHKYIDSDGKWANIVGGIILGAAINTGFYYLELSVSGEKFNRNDLLATMAAGAVSGAIAGASFGAACIPASGLGKLAANMGINYFSNLLSTGTEMAVHNLLEPKKHSLESRESVGSLIREEIADTSVDISSYASTFIETVTNDFGGSNIGGPFVGEILSQTVKMGLKYLDSRTRESTFTNTYKSPFIDGR